MLGIIEGYVGNFDFSFDFEFVKAELNSTRISISRICPSKCFSTAGLKDWKIDPSLPIKKGKVGGSPRNFLDGRGVKRFYFVNPKNPLNSSQHILVEERDHQTLGIAKKLGERGRMRWMAPDLLDYEWERKARITPYLAIEENGEYDISTAPSQSAASFRIFSVGINNQILPSEYSEDATVVMTSEMKTQKKQLLLEKVDGSRK